MDAESYAHGLYSTYLNHGCKCVDCCGAWAVYMREYRAKRARRERYEAWRAEQKVRA